MGRAESRLALDKESQSILYEGANITQLTLLLKCDHKVLRMRMHGMQPIGKRNGVEIYDIAEVAARMGKLSEEQVDAAMKRLNHDQLPKLLTKEYWNGKRARQAFEKEEGDLWETTTIVSEIGEMVKALKMELDLLIDGIERQAEMTDKQRAIAKVMINGTKANMLKRLRERFEEKVPVRKAKPVPVEDDDEL